MQEALEHYRRPAIFNAERGCQFTSEAFIGMLREPGIRIGMDGKGCWVDNVFVERLWPSLKYGEVYRRVYNSTCQARTAIRRYLAYFNTVRRPQSPGRRTPDAVYFGSAKQRKAA